MAFKRILFKLSTSDKPRYGEENWAGTIWELIRGFGGNDKDQEIVLKCNL